MDAKDAQIRRLEAMFQSSLQNLILLGDLYNAAYGPKPAQEFKDEPPVATV